MASARMENVDKSFALINDPEVYIEGAGFVLIDNVYLGQTTVQCASL